MASNCRKRTEKRRKGHGWEKKLEEIKTDCIWVNLKNIGLFIICIKLSLFYNAQKLSLFVDVALILPVKDCFSAHLKVKAHN